jgi:glyoxylase-like metal-dependent hydrolase (beta-lactamase superfamily II)
MKKRKASGKLSVSRRDFLRSAGVGLVAAEVAGAAPGKQQKPAAAPPPAAVHFTPSGGLTQISPHLYVLEDTCNVYVLKNQDRAILIDFGSGHVLNLLTQIGVTKVEAILHTHHHRDQCQGDLRAVTERIPILVPEHERYLFDDAENFWRNRSVFEIYYVKNDFFSLTHNVPVAGVLRDYDTYRWGPYELMIYPAPGHSLGSVSLMGMVDGKKVAFTGDLIHSPGKVVNLYELQYQYGSTDGVDCAVYSLTRLREQGPELICPSHGEAFSQPDAGIADLINKLRGWFNAYAPGTSLSVDNQSYAVTPHLVASYQTTSSSYALISDSGKALFVDYGSASSNFFNSYKNGSVGVPSDRMGFIEHTVPQLKAQFGLKSVDVIMPSHMHDDHLNGFPHLQRHHGAKVWCYENMVDVLENPRHYNLGCILGEPIKIDRSFRDGETFKWEEFEFQVFHSPGHTEYQMAMFGNIDGARVAFTGDAFFPTGNPDAYLRHNLIFRNWVENDSHVRSIKTILEHEPNIVAPGHGKPFLSNKADLENLKERLENQQKYFFAAIADPDCNFGLNPSWARMYPYQLSPKAGGSSNCELRVRNYRSGPMHVEAAVVVPEGWKASPQLLDITVPPGQDGSAPFSVSVPADWDRTKPRVAFAADIRADGKYLGQIAEGVADVEYGVS